METNAKIFELSREIEQLSHIVHTLSCDMEEMKRERAKPQIELQKDHLDSFDWFDTKISITFKLPYGGLNRPKLGDAVRFLGVDLMVKKSVVHGDDPVIYTAVGYVLRKSPAMVDFIKSIIEAGGFDELRNREKAEQVMSEGGMVKGNVEDLKREPITIPYEVATFNLCVTGDVKHFELFFNWSDDITPFDKIFFAGTEFILANIVYMDRYTECKALSNGAISNELWDLYYYPKYATFKKESEQPAKKISTILGYELKQEIRDYPCKANAKWKTFTPGPKLLQVAFTSDDSFHIGEDIRFDGFIMYVVAAHPDRGGGPYLKYFAVLANDHERFISKYPKL